MTALSDYAEFRRSAHYVTGVPTVPVQVADAAIESLKVCGNCDHIEYWHEDIDCMSGKWTHTTPGGRSFETSAVDPGDHCHFTPSRWAERC